MGLYELPRNSTVDGVIQDPDATGITTSVLHARTAFDVFTAANPAQVAQKTAIKTRKYNEAVRAVGDRFCAVPFTPTGTPYPEAMDLLSKITHSGDKLPATAGRDAPRFIHDSTSYVTNTHTNHTIHACSLAAVRAATKAMRAYATTRAINHGLRLNSANSPGIVPPPTLHTVTHPHSNTSPPSNISPHSSPSNISPPSSPDQ